MSLLTHLLGTDVRHARWLIAIWVLTTAAALGMEALFTTTYDLRVAEGFGAAAALLVFARVVLTGVVVAVIVQAHPLVGSSAFWMTRPIAAGTLLGSKLLLIAALFLVLPAVAEVLLMAQSRVPAGPMSRVVLESTMVRAAGVLAVMALAAFTPTLTRFFVLVGALIVALILALNLTMLVSMWWPAGTSYTFLSGKQVLRLAAVPRDPTGEVVATLVMIAGLFLLLRIQYARRPRWHAVVTACAVPVIAWLWASFWPWPVLSATVEAPEWARASTSLQLSGNPESVVLDAASPVAEPPAWRLARAEMYLEGVPAGWTATTYLRSAILEHPGGTLTSRGSGVPASLPARRYAQTPMQQALEGVLGVKVFLGFGFAAERLGVVLMAPSADYPPAGARGRYRGAFEVVLHTVDIAAALPLEKGARFQEGAYRFVVDDIRFDEAAPLVRARVSNAASSFDRRVPPSYTVFLRNRRAGVAVAGDMFSLAQFRSMTSSVFGFRFYMPASFGFDAGMHAIRFPPGFVPVGGTPSVFAERRPRVLVDESWVGDAELVIVRTRYGGSVPRTLVMDGVPVRPPQ